MRKDAWYAPATEFVTTGIRIVRRVLRSILVKGRRSLGMNVAKVRGLDVRVQADPASSVGRDLHTYGSRPSEKFLIPFMRHILRDGDIFLDVGAHVGLYSMVAGSLVGSSGRVFAFEPSNKTFRQLMSNAELNGFPNFTGINCAIGATDGEGFLFVPDGLFRENLNRGSVAAPEGVIRREKSHVCRIVRLSSILAEYDIRSARLIKVDIEGAESEIVSDLTTCMDCFEILVIELHPNEYGPDADVAALHKCLADGRTLYAVQIGSFRRVVGLTDFYQALPNYYFVSVKSSLKMEMIASIEKFAW